MTTEFRRPSFESGPVDVADRELDRPEPSRQSGPTARSDERSVPRRMLSVLVTIVVLVFAIYLWPARLGGSTRLVIVSGDSMQPTYDLGDLVVSRDSGTIDLGDVVVFEVPTGPAEHMLVIHRVLEIDDDGTITTQGDNRATPDRWPLDRDDVVGEPVAHIPKAGLIVWMLRTPFVLACIAVLILALLLWPRDPKTDDVETDRDDDLDRPEPSAEPTVLPRRPLVEHEMWRLETPPAIVSAASPLAVDGDEQRRRLRRIGDGEREGSQYFFDLGAPIDPVVMAEAEAWVDEQLALAASR